MGSFLNSYLYRRFVVRSLSTWAFSIAVVEPRIKLL